MSIDPDFGRAFDNRQDFLKFMCMTGRPNPGSALLMEQPEPSYTTAWVNDALKARARTVPSPRLVGVLDHGHAAGKPIP